MKPKPTHFFLNLPFSSTKLTLRKIEILWVTSGLIISLCFQMTQGIGKNLNPETTSKNAKLTSNFIKSPIKVDGRTEAVWKDAKASRIALAMNNGLSKSAKECRTSGTVRSLWDGALLYLLIDVTDNDVTTKAETFTDKDGVEIYLDFWNDKFPKYEEDDGIIRISSDGELSGSGVYADRLNNYAVIPVFNENNIQTGYSVEVSIFIGGIPMKNGSSLGMEFGINDATSASNARMYRIFWSDGNNADLNDNSRWGEVTLTGYDGQSPMAIDTYMISTNIQKAESISKGIWVSEDGLDLALATAKSALTSTSQNTINASNQQLDQTIKALRRKGAYPDPFELPAVEHLPDPFTFFNGKKVKSQTDWVNRKEEIKALAQYYEYGYMPKAPEKVSATVDSTQVKISVQDKGLTASFEAVLTIPTQEQCGKAGPYPVIVQLEFRPRPASEIYLKAGYAVLGVSYRSVASDNDQHTGAFYSLHPYDVTTGQDAGTLVAWAWGASRGVDALQYLSENDPVYRNVFDLKKLVVTGFSRLGKAALFAGLMDERFGVVSPGASGCGGAAAYRYDAFGNTPKRKAFGNVYEWGQSPGGEVLGDKIRHQGHNSNEMLRRFLSPDRIYKTTTFGYAERLPYDHHEIIAAIAPRAVLITTATTDYSNNTEGDCISYEGAKPVFDWLNAKQNLALNVRTLNKPNPYGWGGGHFLDETQIENLVLFSNMIFESTPLPELLESQLYQNPYSVTFDKYYGGLKTMMPWKDVIPAAEK